MEEVTLAVEAMVLRKDHKGEHQSYNYAVFKFEVPDNCASISIEVIQESVSHAQIPLFLFDSSKTVRMMRTEDGSEGSTKRVLSVGRVEASSGAIPGSLPPGSWTLLIYKRRMLDNVNISFEITAKIAPCVEALGSANGKALAALTGRTAFSSACPEKGRRWYRGELHVHSTESTGKGDIPAIVRTARDLGLDYLAVTDHFSASHWAKIEELAEPDKKPLILQSMEIAGDYGHANIHGAASWPFPLVDEPDALSVFLDLEKPPSMETIADIVHSQGGLFCINHPLSGIFGWRYRSFPIKKADLIEILCTPDFTTSFLYPNLWDVFLCQGLHITGVGSCDSHHPTNPGAWKLGVVSTWVYAEELSQNAVLEGLKRGSAYVSVGSSRMDFFASAGGKQVMMGETLAAEEGEKIKFHITLSNHPSGNLLVISDGFLHDVVFFEAKPGGEDFYDFDFACSFPEGKNETYFRIEFHEDIVKSRFYGMLFRNHETARLLSNPVWIRRNF